MPSCTRCLAIGNHWPAQIADARELIGQANLARDQWPEAIQTDVKNELIIRFRDSVPVGLPDTTTHGNNPGERNARLLLQVLRDRSRRLALCPRPEGVIHIQPSRTLSTTEQIPQQNISGQLTSENRTRDRYMISTTRNIRLLRLNVCPGGRG